MIHPHPTTKIDPHLARGVYGGVVPATPLEPEYVALRIPNTNYELHLVPTGPITAAPGKRLIGTIRAKARRMDSVGTGGKYIEPVVGRPRRVQGRVIAIDAERGEVLVDAGVPILATPTDARQAPTAFRVGQLVSFDALEGSTLEPAP